MRCIFVLGAGRSGTSLVASLFEASADPPTSSYVPRTANPHGFFEDQRANAVNERILSRYLPASCPLSMGDYGATLPGPGQFWLARLSADVRLELLAEERQDIKAITKTGGFCIKDPRLSYTLALWHDCLSVAQLAAVKQVCVFRDPARVVSSVVRELLDASYLHDLAISVDQILENWRLQYERIISKYSSRGEWFFVDYESLFQESTLQALEQFCQLDLQRNRIEPSLNRSQPSIDIPASVQSLYERLQSMANDSLEGQKPALKAALRQLPLVMTILCRNEIDIIKAQLDFHLALGVEHFIITDNASDDGTYEFLREYQKQHPIELLQEQELNHDQGRWVSRMATLAYQRFGACWLIHSDADEFWQPRSGNLLDFFSALPEEVDAISVNRCNLLPPRLDDPQADRPFYSRLFVKEVKSKNALGEPLPPKIAHRARADVRIGEGNHDLFRNNVEMKPLPVSDLEIIHIPVRSLQQFERKIRHGSEALQRNYQLAEYVGRPWRHLASVLEREGSLLSHYQTLCLDEEQIRAGLQNGRFSKEDRIFQLLTGRYSRRLVQGLMRNEKL